MALTFKATLELISTFDGKKALEWQEEVELALANNKEKDVSDLLVISALKKKLIGDALLYWEEQPKENRPKTLEAFWKLMGYFNNVSFHSKNKSFMESILATNFPTNISYYSKKLEALNLLANYDELTKIQELKKSLPMNVKTQLVGIKSLTGLREALFEIDENEAQAKLDSVTPSVNAVTPVSPAIQKKFSGDCYHCGKRGHRIADCRRRKQGIPSVNRTEKVGNGKRKGYHVYLTAEQFSDFSNVIDSNTQSSSCSVDAFSQIFTLNSEMSKVWPMQPFFFG